MKNKGNVTMQDLTKKIDILLLREDEGVLKEIEKLKQGKNKLLISTPRMKQKV